ncbi:hypothetical protein FOZ63_029545, partial [Perkinsus olseni]
IVTEEKKLSELLCEIDIELDGIDAASRVRERKAEFSLLKLCSSTPVPEDEGSEDEDAPARAAGPTGRPMTSSEDSSTEEVPVGLRSRPKATTDATMLRGCDSHRYRYEDTDITVLDQATDLITLLQRELSEGWLAYLTSSPSSVLITKHSGSRVVRALRHLLSVLHPLAEERGLKLSDGDLLLRDTELDIDDGQQLEGGVERLQDAVMAILEELPENERWDWGVHCEFEEDTETGYELFFSVMNNLKLRRKTSRLSRRDLLSSFGQALFHQLRLPVLIVATDGEIKFVVLKEYDNTKTSWTPTAVDPDSTLHNFDVVNVAQTDDSRGVNAVRACRVSQMKNSLTFYVDDREKNVVKTTEVRCGRYNWIHDFDYGAIQLVGMDGIDYNVLYGREKTTTPLDRLLPEQYVGKSVTEENCRSMVRDIRDFAFKKTGAHLFGYLCPSYLTLNEELFVDPQVHSSLFWELMGSSWVLRSCGAGSCGFGPSGLVLTRRGLASSSRNIPFVPIREIKGHEIDVQEMRFYEDGMERKSSAASSHNETFSPSLLSDPLTHSLVRRTPDGECQVLEDKCDQFCFGEATEVLATTTLKASPSDPITKQFCGDA